MELTIRKTLHRSGIGLVFVGAEDDGASRSYDAAKELLNLFLSRLGVGPSILFFENQPFNLLSGPHRAAAPELRVVEPVDEVRGADQEVDVHRPVLAVLETSKAIEDQGLAGCFLRAILFMEEQAVSPETIRQAPNCRVRDTCFSGDLSQPRAGNQAVEDGFEEVASAEPIVRSEGL